ncbi:hypothetical protein ACHAXA_005717 [Cyclostephanos tholiformis]|uniref:Uncharacterized protein n=1 Tax=Cyclostephanos tholiformis TaxID=382380 RepID=A0ABD3RHD5_9STRA
MKTLQTILLLAVGSVSQTWAFRATISSEAKRSPFITNALSSTRIRDDGCVIATGATSSEGHQKRRYFLLQSLGLATLIPASAASFPFITNAADDFIYKREVNEADLTSQLFNPDGSLRDPNMIVEAQEKAVDLSFSIPSYSDAIHINIAMDGLQPTSLVTDAATNLRASYNLPLKWNLKESLQLPLYYDSSEGKNGKSCNRITVYSISKNDLDATILKKASEVGVAKSLFMDRISNDYFDKGVQKADLISGRTVRKPIQSLKEKGEFDEQVYYEFDLAFAPAECPGYMEGNKENLGLGFCPYDSIYLVSATVLKTNEGDEGGTMMCCVVECNKNEWKIANSDLRRIRNSFKVLY